MTTSIVIAIGNSDNKLSQARWSLFYGEVDATVRHYEQLAGFAVHGRWVSPSTAPWQNAAWSLGVEDDMLTHTRDLKHQLQRLLPAFGQDSLAWTVGQTLLLSGHDGEETG